MLKKRPPDVLYSIGMLDHSPFDKWWPKARCVVISHPSQMRADENAVTILWGGADIHPSIYGHPNVASIVGGEDRPSPRDFFEMVCYNKAVKLGIPVIGVCRGAQLSCALNGGVLVQDVDGHECGTHRIETWDGKSYMTSSVHHQLMWPAPSTSKLVAWAEPTKSTKMVLGLEPNWPKSYMDKLWGLEPEILYFPKTNTLAIQGHPEYQLAFDPLNRYVKDFIEYGT